MVSRSCSAMPAIVLDEGGSPREYDTLPFR